jgi:hypothetical protein
MINSPMGFSKFHSAWATDYCPLLQAQIVQFTGFSTKIAGKLEQKNVIESADHQAIRENFTAS